MLTLVLLAIALVAQSREEYLATTKYAEKPIAPKYVVVDATSLKSGIKVVSGRNPAWFGFNDPAILVYVPRVDNSEFAVFDFS